MSDEQMDNKDKAAAGQKTKNKPKKIKIAEVIVVEGIHDRQAIDRAVEADCILTQGSTLSPETMKMIKRAQAERGVIILTDPDYVGERLRKEIAREVPGCKHAFLPVKKAVKDGDIGVENARPDAIIQALCQARVQQAMEPELAGQTQENSSKKSSPPEGILADSAEESKASYQPVTWELMMVLGLNGRSDSKDRRIKLAEELGIGYANASQFHKRLLQLRIAEDELMEAYKRLPENKK